MITDWIHMGDQQQRPGLLGAPLNTALDHPFKRRFGGSLSGGRDRRARLGTTG